MKGGSREGELKSWKQVRKEDEIISTIGVQVPHGLQKIIHNKVQKDKQ